MIPGMQIRGVRAVLRWSLRRLAQESGVSVPIIHRVESVDGVPGGRSQNLQTIERTLERAGIVFLDDTGKGVGFRFRLTEHHELKS